jgi:hypothetical protein
MKIKTHVKAGLNPQPLPPGYCRKAGGTQME